MPSIEAMLITLAGLSAVAAARSGAASALVRKNGVLRLRFFYLSQPLSGNSSKSAPQAAPALLTRISSFGSRFLISVASISMPARLEMSIGSAMHSPPYSAVSSFAVASHGPALRAVMYTRGAPCARNPAAIILPMPREPPVTSATRPLSENRSLNMQPPFVSRLCEAEEGTSQGTLLRRPSPKQVTRCIELELQLCAIKDIGGYGSRRSPDDGNW